MKKKIALLLCSTGNEAFAVGNVVIGAKKYLFHTLNENEYDIIFYTDKLLPQDEKALKTIFPNIIINIFNPTFNFKDNVNDITYYSFFTFSRFEAFNMLNYYEKVLYMDTDMVIQKDLSHIININNTFSICYYKNKTIPLYHKMKKDVLDKLQKKYDMNVMRTMAALFLVNDNLPNYKLATKWCYEQIPIYRCNDEDILNIFLQEFNVEVNELSEHYNCMPYSNIAKDAYIIHSLGPAKFWRGTYNEEWENNNRKWIELGGSKTYEANHKKRKIVDKIVWFIPSYKVRNKLRGFLLRILGLSGR